MRRLSGVLLAGAILLLPALAQNALAAQAAPQKFTLEGDLALWSVSVRPDKTADYEQVLGKVKEALQKSAGARGQAAARRLEGPQGREAACPMATWSTRTSSLRCPERDYAVLQMLYEAFTDPAEQKTLYDLYRGAFVGNLGVGSVPSRSTSGSDLTAGCPPSRYGEAESRTDNLATMGATGGVCHRSWLFVFSGRRRSMRVVFTLVAVLS